MSNAKVRKDKYHFTRLKENLHYDPETGIFTRLRISPYSRGVKIGDKAESLDGNGYIIISIDGIVYLAHRLAWLYMTGEIPDHCIDHKDGDPSNNRFCNLREATQQQNCQNRRKAHKNNSVGLLGVYFSSSKKAEKKYIAKITKKGKNIHLGYFATPETAHFAYLEAKRKLHPFCTI